MFKNITLALAALGLVASAPAYAEPRVDFELRVGTEHGRQYNDPSYYRYKRYYDNRRQYKHFPRCNRWEVAVRHPYAPHRYVCVHRKHYEREYRRWN